MFQDFNLNDILIRNLEASGATHTTPIQELAIPKLLAGQNVVMTASTGSGKTFAFLIPLLQQIIQWKPLVKRGCNQPLGLILTPSRELTQQIGVSRTQW